MLSNIFAFRDTLPEDIILLDLFEQEMWDRVTTVTVNVCSSVSLHSRKALVTVDLFEQELGTSCKTPSKSLALKQLINRLR